MSGCFYLRQSDVDVDLLILWPSDFELVALEDSAVAVRGQGWTIADGDEVGLGGSGLDSLDSLPITRDIDVPCGGPYWLLSEVVSVSGSEAPT